MPNTNAKSLKLVIFEAQKMYQNQLLLGLRSRLSWRTLHRSPDPLANEQGHAALLPKNPVLRSQPFGPHLTPLLMQTSLTTEWVREQYRCNGRSMRIPALRSICAREMATIVIY